MIRHDMNLYFFKNNMKRFLCILVLLISTTIQARSIKGVLKDKESRKTISFATILVPELKISTITKSNGSFTLNVADEKDYIVRIEPLGYLAKEIRISDIKREDIILMQEAPELMPELFIPPKNAKVKYHNYGRTSEGSSKMPLKLRSYNRDDYDKGFFFGLTMKNKGFSQLESFHIHINENTYKKLYYRLQIYKTNKGLPSEKMNHPEILFTLEEGQNGWVKLDLEKYNIYLSEEIKHFASVLELVHVEFSYTKEKRQLDRLNLNVALSVNNQMVVRNGYYEEWQKIPSSFPMYFRAKCYK